MTVDWQIDYNIIELWKMLCIATCIHKLLEILCLCMDYDESSTVSDSRAPSGPITVREENESKMDKLTRK